MNKSEQIKSYVLTIKMRQTVINQIRVLKRKADNFTISYKTETKYRKIIKYKELRLKRLTEKMNAQADELNFNPGDRHAYMFYGMSLKEVEKAKGKEKDQWGRMIEILHQVFMEECY